MLIFSASLFRCAFYTYKVGMQIADTSTLPHGRYAERLSNLLPAVNRKPQLVLLTDVP